MISALLKQFNSDEVLAFSKNTAISHTGFWQVVLKRQAFLFTQNQQCYAVWLEDSFEFLAWFLASILADKTIYLPPHRVQDLEQQFAEQGIIFIEQDWSDKAQNINLPILTRNDLEQILQTQLDIAKIIFYTSGSTGEAKQIPRALGQLLAEVSTLQTAFDWQKPFAMLASVSHQHIYGLLFKLLLPLSLGQSFYREQVVYPEYLHDVQQYISEKGIDQYLITSPALLKRCIGQFDFAKAKQIFSSGGRLESGIRQHYSQHIVEVLGSTETGGIATRFEDDSSWQAMADVEIRVDESQQLWVKTAHAYQPDWQNDRQDGWIATGDLAEIKANGFQLLGRADRIVKLEEKRISLNAVEQAIDRLEYVVSSKALLIKHGNRELLATVIALDQSGLNSLMQLGKLQFVQQFKAKLTESLELIALPRQWRFVTQIPHNAQSKINMQQLKTLFETQHFPLELQPVQVDQYDSSDSAHSQYPLSVQYQLQFLPEMICFQGHFDDLPIYPGVGQIAFLIEYIGRHWTDFDFCTGFEQLKFQDIIRPYDVISLRLERLQDKVVFQMTNQRHEKVASGRLKFALKHSG